MSREIPEVVRAAAGLAATVLDEARKLPETLPGLPVRVIGLAMQQAMKVQQQYAGLVARGDELFTGIRGEDEPGLATFDDDEPDTATPAGFRDSAFDRAGDTSASDPSTYVVTEDGVELPADPPADTVTAVVDDLATQVETGQQSIEELADQAPAIAEILDEIAIDELVDQAPTLRETAPTAAETLDAEPTADVATTVDVLTADGEVTSVEATVTDEGIAAPLAAGSATDDAGTATDEGGTPVAAATGAGAGAGDTSAAPTDGAAAGSDPSGSQAVGAAPIDGYDTFTIAQLRGRLRGYALSTVQDLIAYEEAARNREPYLKMLRNRLEKLEEQAVAASPLAPRGA
jgi:hypothetical protein